MKWRGFQQEPVPLGLAAVVVELIYIPFSLLWVRVWQSPNPWVQGTDKLKEMKNLWRGLLQWDESSITPIELYTQKVLFSKSTCGCTEKMSCAVVLRHRLVAPHLHSILSSLCIVTSLYVCFGNLPCSPASCKYPVLTSFSWKSRVPIPLLWHLPCCVEHGSGAPGQGLPCQGQHPQLSCSAQPGGSQAGTLCTLSSGSKGKRHKSKVTHIPRELVPVHWRVTWTLGDWICGEQSHWMAMANINLCCFIAARVLLIFCSKRCDDVRGQMKISLNDKLHGLVLWEKWLKLFLLVQGAYYRNCFLISPQVLHQ